MLPLGYDCRMMYRKHQVGETVVDGIAEPTWETDGPHLVSFNPGKESRTLTEQGYSIAESTMYCIAPDTRIFESGDVLTDGTNDLYKISEVKTFPTEQQFYARELR